MKKSSKKSGFSLIELAVSVIIIGLIVAGITGGTKLLKQAELRNVISDYQRFASYYNIFLGEYDAVPGDFDQASSYWTGTSCHATVAAACDGDGDGLIRWRDVAVTGAGAGDEAGRALKHLDLAGIMTESIDQLTATYAGGMNLLSTATQIEPPHGKSDKTKCFFYAYNPATTATTSDAIGENAAGTVFYASPWAGQNINAVFYGGMIATANKSCLNGSLTPLEAFGIDRKIDDADYISSAAAGATTGNFRSINSASGTCLSGNNYATATDSEVCFSGLAMSN